jgi:hypothetical protein
MIPSGKRQGSFDGCRSPTIYEGISPLFALDQKRKAQNSNLLESTLAVLKMASYEKGDYVKVEFPDETTGIAEWMWVRVEVCDDRRKMIVGRLDNQPLNNYEGKIGLDSQILVSFSNVREHRKPSEFTKQ